MRWCLLFSLACAGCGAAILKSPIVGECERAGLRGCDAMTDGIILVVEGEKQEGLRKVAAGAADNAPDDLKKFLVGLKALRSIPGTEQYMQPVWEVVDYLEKDLPKGDAHGGGVVVVEHRAKAGTAPPDRLLTADTDARQLDGGAVVPAVTGNKRRKCDGPNESASTCVNAATGPLVVTTLLRTSDACRGVFVAVRDALDDGDSFDWLLGVEHDVSARIYVPQGKQLVVGAPRGDANCGVVWSGFRPYPERE